MCAIILVGCGNLFLDQFPVAFLQDLDDSRVRQGRDVADVLVVLGDFP